MSETTKKFSLSAANMSNNDYIDGITKLAEMTRRNIEVAKNMMDYRIVTSSAKGEKTTVRDDKVEWIYSQEIRTASEAVIKDSLDKLKKMNDLIEF